MESSQFVKTSHFFERTTLMKTKEELNVLREEVKTLNKKLAELTDEEMMQVVGGVDGNGVILVTAEGADFEKGNAVMDSPMDKYELA